MMGLPCRFDRAQHWVLRSGIARTIGRVAPERVRGHLFLYYHTRERNYVVGLWLKKGKWFEDILNLGPGMPNARVAEEVGRMFRWNDVPLWKEMLGAQSDRVHRQTDESMETGLEYDWRRNHRNRCRVAM